MVNIQQIDIKANPFCMMGRIVEGHYYIHRESLAKMLSESLLAEDIPSGNIALVGLPRSGKSSVVYNEIILQEKYYWSNKKVPIWVCLDGSIEQDDNGAQLFRLFVEKTYQFLEDHDALDGKLERQAQCVYSANNQWTGVRRATERFFELVGSKGLSIIAVVDEFDAMRKLFAVNPSFLRAFRDLCYYPKFNFTCVGTSRRWLRDIVGQAHGDQSTLPGIFHEEPMSPYSESEMTLFWSRFENSLSDIQKSFITNECGTFPFLLDALGNQIWQVIQRGESVLIESCLEQAFPDFLNCFDAIIKLLDESNSFEKLVELLFGPVVSLNNEDILRLCRMHIVQRSEDRKLSCFSKSFERFLYCRSRERQTNEKLWPEYSTAIKTLRKHIINLFESNDSTWIEKMLSEGDDKICKMLQDCRGRRKLDIEKFGAVRNVPLEEYLDLPEIALIVNKYWSCTFEPIFSLHGVTKKKWNEYVDIIMSVRRPLAHVRDNVHTSADTSIASGYCRKISEIIINIINTQK